MIKTNAIFLLLFGQGILSATSITGTITDKDNNNPLIGANVILKGTIMGAATDVNGEYLIPNVPAGSYTISVNYIGYESIQKAIEIESGKSQRMDFQLVTSAIQMDAYVVTASRRRERVEDAPAAISVITKQDIRRESNTNLGDYLKTTKGLDFTQSGIDSYNITARGFNSSFSSRLMTLTDGRMANVPSLRLTAYNVIPVSFDDVEQIEVVLGPSSALYGPNAHSGVLNIISSSPLRSQGTSVNIMGGTISQSDTDPMQKFTFRTAHKIGKFGIKLSTVVLRGQDWKHFNADEYEGHDVAFLGRTSLRHDGIDNNNNSWEVNNPRFTEAMITEWPGANSNWIGLNYADGISNFGNDAEPGSPKIDQTMIDIAANDPFKRYDVPGTDITLWNVTEDMLGQAYMDGIDNDGNGLIDDGIDEGIDDVAEVWIDGIDNDNDGEIDENDELGSKWIGRFGDHYQNWTVQDGGFGDYEYNENGHIVFDSNKNGIFGDNWGSDGLDNDGDWAPYFDESGNPSHIAQEEFEDLNGNGVWDKGELLADRNFNGIWDDAEPHTEQNGVEGWQNNESYTDNNDNGIFDTGDFLWPWTDWDGDGEWDAAEPYDDTNGDGEFTSAEHFEDDNGNGIWDPNESLIDINGNGVWDQFELNDLDGNGLPSIGEIGVDDLDKDEGDFHLNYGGLPNMLTDANDDGVDDFPDFNVRNYRYDIRADWEPNNDVSLSVNHGYAYARNINITPIARYLADGWIYQYYQARLRYKNFFLQTYLNTSYSGDPENPTRSMATGSKIYDRSKKFSAQFQHALESNSENFRFVWGIDYFLTLPDTRGTILSDKSMSDRVDNNGNGEAGSPYLFEDSNSNGYYDDNEGFTRWSRTSTGVPLTSDDSVKGAIADGIDNDGDGLIDEGIDEPEEDNRYVVNELGMYYQLNWKLSNKFELIQATRFDVHDRLSDFIEFNNQKDYNYSPFKWEFDFDKQDGIQISPKIGLVYKPMDHQNFRLTWAQAFNTPSNQALFLDIFVTRVSIFKVYAKGADGGYVFPRNSENIPKYFDTDAKTYRWVNPDQSIFFYPSVDPKIKGFFGGEVKDLGGVTPEIVQTLEFGYKGRLASNIFGTIDLYASHYSSFVSGATFITPIVIRKDILETDYDGDLDTNRISEIDENIISDQEDYNEALDRWRSGLMGITAIDTTPGFTPPVIVGYVNYGEVDLWGLDASLAIFLNREWSLNLTYSLLGMNEFLNPITNAYDPINAPKHKAGMQLQYTSKKLPINLTLNARYVDAFKWSSGIYYGNINAYTIFDIHTGYKINDHLKANLTINNVLNHHHTEIMGGPEIGQMIVLRLQANL